MGEDVVKIFSRDNNEIGVIAHLCWRGVDRVVDVMILAWRRGDPELCQALFDDTVQRYVGVTEDEWQCAPERT